MKKMLAVLLAVLMSAAVLPLAVAEGTVVVYNWEDYIDPDVQDLFEQETGIQVKYVNFTQNEDMLVEVRTSPNTFDVVFPSDYAIERLIKEDLLAELDYSKLPNAENLLDWVRDLPYDPQGAHSVPYMWGTLGILYNTTMITEEVDSWAILFDKKYQKDVLMWDSIRDSMGLALIYLGYSANSRNAKEIQEATQLLIQQKVDGIVKAYQGDEMKDKMVAGEAAMAVQYSGDAQYAIDLNENLAYAVPKEGSNIFVDAMVIPKGAPNMDNAHAFINFMLRPDIAQRNCEYIRYSSTNKAAIDLMGEEYTSNPNLNPSQEVLDRCGFYEDIEEPFLTLYNNRWSEVKNAK